MTLAPTVKNFGKLVLLSCLFISCAPKNYKYAFKSSCNCIVSKNNPAGIEEVSVFPYDKDPEIHEHNAGYYSKTSQNVVKQFNLLTFNPADFSCNPCLSFVPDKKYVFMLKGMPGKDDVSVKVYKDKMGVLQPAK
jgi:hypothetical protein